MTEKSYKKKHLTSFQLIILRFAGVILKGSILLMLPLRKLILLIPLIFILPLFIQNKVFAVFLAEPISDILAAIITTSTFFRRFDKILDRR